MNKQKLKMSEICCLYYFVMRAGFLGITSSIILHASKQDGWLAMLLGMFLGVIPLLIFLYIQNKYPNDSIFNITKIIFGKVIGKIINAILVVCAIYCTIITFYNLINFIGSQYLNRTPTIAIAIMFFIAITYILSKGIIVIARTHIILFYFEIILFSLAVIGLIGEADLLNLKPILEFGMNPVLKGGMSFIEFNVLPLFMLSAIPREATVRSKHFNRNIIITYFVGAATLFVIFFLIITVFGPYLALLYQYPEFHLLKLISIGGFVSRLEGIIALHWLFDFFAFIVIGIYFVMEYLKVDWSIKQQHYNFIMVVCGILLIIATEHIFKNNTIANYAIANISPWIIFIIFLIIPIIIALSCIKKKT